jgi:hypothetical protein
MRLCQFAVKRASLSYVPFDSQSRKQEFSSDTASERKFVGVAVKIIAAESQTARGLCYVQQFVRLRLNWRGYHEARHCRAAALFEFTEQSRELFNRQLTGGPQHELELVSHIKVSARAGWLLPMPITSHAPRLAAAMVQR